MQRSSGVRVGVPPAFALHDAAPTSARRRGRAPATTAPDAEDDALVREALGGLGFDALDAFELAPATLPSGRRGLEAPAIPARQTVPLDVPLGEEEDAVVLVEQDGLYTWHFPDAHTHAAARRGARGAPARRAQFHIDVFAGSTQRRRRSRRGFVQNLLFGKVKTLVLRFIARPLTTGLVKLVERNVRPGLVRIPSPALATWSHQADGLGLDGAATERLLLLLHGTFSSTMSAYSGLGVTPWGQGFLGEALQRYDLVLGYDHPTLSVDPRRNAEALYQALRDHAAEALEVDVVAHSRGGLVYRSLAELILPGAAWKPSLGRAVFVGVPNEGTTLAEPANWHALVDLYFNLAVGATKALALFPQAAAVAKVLQELIQGLGDLIKYLATEAVTRRRIPGLAAMKPGSAFLRTLNAEQPGQAGPGEAFFYGVTSTFDVHAFDDLGEADEPVLKQLPKRLLLLLADKVAGRLLGRDSDLVVNTDSMLRVDAQGDAFFREAHEFGRNAQVYHTNYFYWPQVTEALGRWLGVPTPRPPQMSARRGARTTAGPTTMEDLAALARAMQ